MGDIKKLEATARYRKTKKGQVTNIYQKMKRRHETTISLSDLHEFSNCKKYDRIFKEWEKSGYNKQFSPSIDRISNKKGYSKDNIHWLTWAENRYKQSMEMRCRKGKVAKVMGDKIIEIYLSQRDAIAKTGLFNISSAINGRRKHVGGYKWVYVSNTAVIGTIHTDKHLLP